MATLYFCALPSATTPTWNRANIGTNAGFSDSPPMYGTQGSAPAAPQTDYEPTISWTGSLTAGTAYKLWAIWDDGSASSNDGDPFGSDAFEAIFTSTGALTAQAAEVAGTAAHYTLHASTGALAAQAATVAGTAVHLTLHTSTGALSAQAATVAGTALHEGVVLHESTGALSAQAATVAGTASHLTLHASTGAMAAQAATVAGTAAHYTLHTSTGALEAGSATVSGTAVDETTYVPPVPQQSGGGKSRKPRKRRYQVEIDGEVHEVESLQEAEAVMAEVAQKATETAKLAIERAAKAKRRPVRKIIRDAEKALTVPDVAVSPSLQSYADQLIGKIRAEYQSALSAIEIAAHMAQREREIEEDDEDVLMLL